MDRIESYVIGMVFVLLSGFFSGGAGKLLEMERRGVLNDQISPSIKLGVLVTGGVAVVYAILWGLAVNHKVLVMLPYLGAWFFGSYIAHSQYGSDRSWRFSLLGLIAIPLAYHLVSPAL